MEHASSRKTWVFHHYLNAVLALVVAAFFTVACTGHDIFGESFSADPALQGVEQVQGVGLTFEEYLSFQEEYGDGCYIVEGDILACADEELRYAYDRSGASGELALGLHLTNDKAVLWTEVERRQLTYCVDRTALEYGHAFRWHPDPSQRLTCTQIDADNKPKQSNANYILDNPGRRKDHPVRKDCIVDGDCKSNICEFDAVAQENLCQPCDPTDTNDCGDCDYDQACFNGEPFMGLYEKTVLHMEQAAEEWESYLGVDFIHLSQHDGNCNPLDHPWDERFWQDRDEDAEDNEPWDTDFPLFFVRPWYAMEMDAPNFAEYRELWEDEVVEEQAQRFDGKCSGITGLGFFPHQAKNWFMGDPEKEDIAYPGGWSNRTLAFQTGLALPSRFQYEGEPSQQQIIDGDYITPGCQACANCAQAQDMASVLGYPDAGGPNPVAQDGPWPDTTGGLDANCNTKTPSTCVQDSDCFSQHCVGGVCQTGLPRFGYYLPTCPKCPTYSELNDTTLCKNPDYAAMGISAYSCSMEINEEWVDWEATPVTYPDLSYYENDFRGLLLHELGHILALAHEHGGSGYGSCPEKNVIIDMDDDGAIDDRRGVLTPFDAHSVMQYPWCFSMEEATFSVSPMDVCGSQAVYYPDAGDWALNSLHGDPELLNFDTDGFLLDDADKDRFRDFCDGANGQQAGYLVSDPGQTTPVGTYNERVWDVTAKTTLDYWCDPWAGNALSGFLVVPGTQFQVEVTPVADCGQDDTCSNPNMNPTFGIDLVVGPSAAAMSWGDITPPACNQGSQGPDNTFAHHIQGSYSTPECYQVGNGARCTVTVPEPANSTVSADVTTVTAAFRPRTTNIVQYRVTYNYVEACALDQDRDGKCDGIDDDTDGHEGVDFTYDGNYMDLPDFTGTLDISKSIYNSRFVAPQASQCPGWTPEWGTETPEFTEFMKFDADPVTPEADCYRIYDDGWLKVTMEWKPRDFVDARIDEDGNALELNRYQETLYLRWDDYYWFTDVDPPGGYPNSGTKIEEGVHGQNHLQFEEAKYVSDSNPWSADGREFCLTGRYWHEIGTHNPLVEDVWRCNWDNSADPPQSLFDRQTESSLFHVFMRTWLPGPDPERTCQWDLNRDETVDAADLRIVEECMGQHGSGLIASQPRRICREADFIDNDVIDTNDWNVVNANQGACPGMQCADPADTCPWDFNDDGEVSFADQTELLNCYSTPTGPGCHDKDLNCDGQVSFADMTLFLGYGYGDCPATGGSGPQQDIQTGSVGAQQVSPDYVYTVEPGSTFDARTLATAGSVTMLINWDAPADYSNYVEARYMTTGMQYPVSLTVPGGTTEAYVAIVGGSGSGGSYTLTVDWVGPGGGSSCTGANVAEDAANGLCWEVTGALRTPAAAPGYCSGLNIDGYDDWRMPTFDELRTLVSGCASMESGGSCQVTDPSCLAYTSCFAACNMCTVGNYMSSILPGDDSAWLSSSRLSDYTDFTLALKYHKAEWKIYTDNQSGNAVRCVRDI